jgi:hypothetical protein
MRLVVGLLACLSAGALTSALADPLAEPTPAPAAADPAAAAAPAAVPTAATPAAKVETASAAAKPAVDLDTQHFLALGYKPEMRGGQQVYCRRETALGSRLAPVKNCGTIEQLKLIEQQTKSGLRDTQRQQVGIGSN